MATNRECNGSVGVGDTVAPSAAGGDVVPSFGGWSGNKLGPNCSTPQALAGAYQQVINAYGLKAIDIENTDEFENAAVQDRILEALEIVKANNPGIRTIVTFGTTTTGPNSWGNRLVERAAAPARCRPPAAASRRPTGSSPGSRPVPRPVRAVPRPASTPGRPR